MLSVFELSIVKVKTVNINRNFHLHNNIYKMQKPQHKVTVSRSVIETTEGMVYIVTYQVA